MPELKYDDHLDDLPDGEPRNSKLSDDLRVTDWNTRKIRYIVRLPIGDPDPRGFTPPNAYDGWRIYYEE